MYDQENEGKLYDINFEIILLLPCFDALDKMVAYQERPGHANHRSATQSPKPSPQQPLERRPRYDGDRQL